MIHAACRRVAGRPDGPEPVVRGLGGARLRGGCSLVTDERAPLAAAGRRELALLAGLAVVWSSSFLAIKLGVATIAPATLAAGRLGIAAVLLLVVLAVGKRRLPLTPHSVGIYFFVGLFGNALPFALIGWGETEVDSGLAAILMGAMPVATAGLAHFFTPEDRLTLRRLCGILLGLGGVLALIGWQALGGLGRDVLAQLALLGGALCYAVTTVFVRRYGNLPGRVMATGAMLAGALLAGLFALVTERPWTLAPSAASWLALIYLGVLPTAAAALVYFHLIRKVGATMFSQINFVLPALGALWGAVFLGERIGLNAWLALGLIAIGVALVNSRRRVYSPG